MCPSMLCVLLSLIPQPVAAQNDDDRIGPEFLARLRGGGTVNTQFVHRYAGPGQILPPKAADVSLKDVSRIQFANNMFRWKSHRPARIVTLWTGEFFIPSDFEIFQPVGDYQLNQISLKWLEALMHSGPRRGSPLECVASVRPPHQASDLEATPYTIRIPGPDERPILKHLKPALGWKTAVDRQVPAATWTLPHPAHAVTASVTDLGVSRFDVGSTTTIRFELSDSRGSHEITVRIARTAEDELSCTLNSDIPISPRRISDDYVSEVGFLLDDSLVITVNGQLLGSAPRVRGALSRIHVQTTGAALSDVSRSLESVRVRFRRQPIDDAVADRRLTPVRDSHSILLTNGDELFGSDVSDGRDPRKRGTEYRESIDWNPKRHEILQLTTRGGPIYVPWPDIAELQFRHSPKPIIDRWPHHPTAVGWIANIRFVPDATCVRFGEPDGGWLRGAIYGATRDSVRVSHPLIGGVRVPWEMLQWIDLLGYGTLRMLDAGPRHLGNGIRQNFSSPEPVGIEWTLKWNLEKLPEHPVFLTADVAELIPSGPDTLNATPFLNEVRDGYLSTYLIVNGERIGTLNEYVSRQYPANAPHRIRIRIPSGVLKTGANTIAFRQTSARDDAASFDDFEIRAIAIEEKYAVPE